MKGITSAKPVAVGRSNAFPAPINTGSEVALNNPIINDPMITPGIEPIVPRTMIANAGNSNVRPSTGLIGNIAASNAQPRPEIQDERKAVLTCTRST